MEENENKDNKTQEEVTHILPEKLSEMTGYDHLYLMCKHVRNKSHSGSGYMNPITPRLKYIMDALSYQGIPFNFVPLESYHSASDTSEYVDSNDRKLANIMVEFEGVDNEKPTVIFTAHHDIANPNSENCQDNTASVCNLIHLCQVLKEYQSNGLLEQNVVVGFTDCEEMGGRGMNMLITQIKNGVYGEVEAMFALELSANGKNVWVQGLKEGAVANKLELVGAQPVSTPYNEAMNAQRQGLPAVCIGTLNDSELKTVTNGRGYCETWGLCHRMEDTFERSAVQEDMNQFVETMVSLVDTSGELSYDEAEEEMNQTESDDNSDNPIGTILRIETDNNNNHSAAYNVTENKEE